MIVHEKEITAARSFRRLMVNRYTSQDISSEGKWQAINRTSKLADPFCNKKVTCLHQVPSYVYSKIWYDTIMVQFNMVQYGTI